MKNSKKGISLIVLIITIIVIVILATAILVSVLTNNPISEANKARYESDRDNMQAVFTNTVGKIMAKELGSVKVTPGQVNTITKDVSEAVGEVVYTVENATVAANARGKIVFDKGTNEATTYYIGKKLPIYQAGETKWYVDSEGILSLEVAGEKYGSGEILISLSNWEHQLSDGTVEEHIDKNIDGICDICGEDEIPGLYQPDGTFVSWSNLIENEILKITDGILNNNTTNNTEKTITTLNGTLIVSNNIKSTGVYAFSGCVNLVGVKLPNTITTFAAGTFSRCTNLSLVLIPNSVTTLPFDMFHTCTNLKSITIPKNITTIGYAFAGCTYLTEINYEGTSDEWNTIDKMTSPAWNWKCPEITVHCTDGDIIIPAYEG